MGLSNSKQMSFARQENYYRILKVVLSLALLTLSGTVVEQCKFPLCSEHLYIYRDLCSFSNHRSDYSKEAGGKFIRICLKIAKKCGLYLDIFSCVKMNVFCMFFTFRLEMHVRCDNQYKTGADRENILGQPMLFECMGICVLSLVHESEMRSYLVYVLIVKYLTH